MKRLLAILLAALSFNLRAADDGALELSRTVALPDVSGRIDHMAADAAGKRLFVAALGNNTLEIIDLEAGRRLGTIRDLHEPQGVAYLRESNRICVANGDDGTCKVFDGTTAQFLRNFPDMPDADNVRYAAENQLLYVGYGNGALGIIDAARNERAGEIRLGAHPESFQLERRGTRIFVNVPGANQIAVVDRAQRKVAAIWPMKEFRSNFPMALDEENHRLFVGCRHPAKLAVIDATDGKVLMALPIVSDTDDVFYDAKRRRLYVSGGGGSITVIRQVDADHYAVVENVTTASGARTSYFVPELDLFCVAVPKHIGQSAEIRIYKVR